jgi:hypothetical protein
LSSASGADAKIPVAGDLPLLRDPKFWARKDGSRRLIAPSEDGFMVELPLRLSECREWDDVDDIERANRVMINKLDTETRIEVSAMFAKRRDELRGG